jgi:Transmembrane protein 65
VAGESLELHFGIAFGMSTMAAAGFGNILSDIAGLGVADQIEVLLVLPLLA